jgi:TRAP-type C4-dicarboxylate transport system permease large subunit
MNIFVIQGLTGEKLGTVVRAAFPFFVLMVLFTFLLALFPDIVMFLPSLL